MSDSEHLLLFCLVFCIVPCVIPAHDDDVVVVEVKSQSNAGKQCTFFGDHRISQAESSLINCSWYKSNSCCRRTEVTSVFSGMMKLEHASRDCSNMMHFMMCYFCSPTQVVWYRKRVIICKRFCDAAYAKCRTASYKGVQLGSQYKSGRHFCEAGQNFEVVDQDYNCFDFDPTVFSGSTRLEVHTILTTSFIAMTMSFLLAQQQSM